MVSIRHTREENESSVIPRSEAIPPALRLLRAGKSTAIALFLLGVAALAWKVHDRPKTQIAVEAPPIRSLAVLPLENLSHDSSQDYFADGMTDALINNLSKIGALRVISRTSAMQYKKTRKALPEIARELRVDAIVEGSVQRSENRVRISAQLVDGKTDTHHMVTEL